MTPNVNKKYKKIIDEAKLALTDENFPPIQNPKNNNCNHNWSQNKVMV